MAVKIIACDLDRTLMGEIPIQPEVRDFLAEVQRKGIKFVINSGRSLENILDILSQSEIYFDRGYPEAIISRHGVFIHYLQGKTYVEDEEWNRQRREDMDILQDEIGWKSRSWEKMIEEDLQIFPQKKNIAYGVFEMLFNTDEEAERVRQILLRENDLKYTTFLRNRHFLTATLATALKGRSLSRVAWSFRVYPSQVVAVGDSQNDEDMLDGKYGFIPAAPSNAEPGIKTMVRENKGYVATLPEGRGVVEVVSSLLNGTKS